MIDNPSDVHCVLHPTLAAAGTCERCGNFMCGECSRHGTERLCPTCRERQGLENFPFNRESSLDGLFDFVWKRFTANWLMLSLATIIYFVVVFTAAIPGLVVGQLFPLVAGLQKASGGGTNLVAAGLALAGTFLAQILQLAVSSVMTVGFYALARDVIYGKEPKIERMFSQLGKTGAVLGALFIGSLFFVLGLAFVGAVVYLSPASARIAVGAIAGVGFLGFCGYALPFAFLNAEIAFTAEPSALQSLRNVFEVGDGRRGTMFLYLLLSGAMMIAGYIACCVGVIPAIALTHLINGGVYLALRRGSSVDPGSEH